MNAETLRKWIRQDQVDTGCTVSTRWAMSPTSVVTSRGHPYFRV